MPQCDVREKVDCTIEGGGSIQGSEDQVPGPAIPVGPISEQYYPVDNLAAAPPGLLHVATQTVQSTKDGPKRFNGNVEFNIPIVIDISVAFDLSAEVQLDYQLDFYTDCEAPHCVEGTIEQQNFHVELWKVIGPDERFSNKIYDFGSEVLEFGNCFSPPWVACCPGKPERKVIRIPPTTAPLLPGIVELRFKGIAILKYQIYNRANNGPGDSDGSHKEGEEDGGKENQ